MQHRWVSDARKFGSIVSQTTEGLTLEMSASYKSIHLIQPNFRSLINPLTPKSDHDQQVNSPHNFNEMSVRQVLRMKLKRRDLDITPNSHNYPAK